MTAARRWNLPLGQGVVIERIVADMLACRALNDESSLALEDRADDGPDAALHARRRWWLEWQ
jgi:hypothetical protein